ncbi:MAG: PQQ-binding-like beta-propeller repeat protein [Pirellulales bacterium]
MLLVLVIGMIHLALAPSRAGDDWPSWRGPLGSAVADGSPLPVEWSATDNVRWKAAIEPDGFSSPIVKDDCVYLTGAFDGGLRRAVYCLDRSSGAVRWKREIEDPDPEVASSMTGHAAATPVTDGQRVVAFFGRAGLVCYDKSGQLLWRQQLGRFESELGLATSPILDGPRVLLVCDHDGDRFSSFDSCLRSFDLLTGREAWRTERPGLYRSFATPIIVPAGQDRRELVVHAQDEVRGYNPDSGELVWHADTMAGWVAPSPVFAGGLVFACSGRNGPLMAIRPGGAGDVTGSHVVWSRPGAGPYVCSPVVYGDHLYVHNEAGVLSCYHAASGRRLYRERLPGKFTASSVAGDGKVYITNEEATTYVVRAGSEFKLLAANRLGEYCLASPAIAGRAIFVRTARHLYCIAGE